MASPYLFLSFCVIAIADCAPTSLDSSCAEVSLDSSCAESVEADVQSLMQQKSPHVRLASRQPTSRASATLAGALRLVEWAKKGMDSADNITLAAASVSQSVEFDVLPGIRAGMAEIGIALVTQRNAVKQCDVDLLSGVASKDGLHRVFQEKRSEYEACVATEAGVAQRAAACLAREAAVKAECAGLEATRAAKAAECEGLRPMVDAAACARASDVRGVCSSYEGCRSMSTALYDEALHVAEKNTSDHRAQLLKAKQAKCIARALVASIRDMEGLLKELEACDDLTPDENDQVLGAMPPAIVCQDALLLPCSEGLLELDIGSADDTWRVPCGACTAMMNATAEASWGASVEEEAATRYRFGALRERIITALAHSGQSAASTLSLVGVGATTTVRTVSEATGANQYVLMLLALPVLALLIALCVAVSVVPSSEGRLSRDGRDGRPSNYAPMPRVTGTGSFGTPWGTALNSLGSLNAKASMVHEPVVSPRIPSRSRQIQGSTGQVPPHSMASAMSLPSGSPYGEAQVFSMTPSTGRSLRPSVVPPIGGGSSPLRPSAVPPLGGLRPGIRKGQIPGGTVGLCPELTIPEGNECILGIPFLAEAVPGEAALKTIANKDGQPLLYAGLTKSPAGGEYILLAGRKDQQELAFCETGAAVRAEGWAGKIFRRNGEVYAMLREASSRDQQRWSGATPSGKQPGASPWSTIPGPLKTFVILSAAGPSWELRLTGNFRERKFAVEDDKQQVVAMVSPGEVLGYSRPASEFYRLRLGPRADACAVIIALMAIERLWGEGEERSSVLPSSRPVFPGV